MVIRSSFQLLLLTCMITVSSYAQNDSSLVTLNIGDPAPPLKLRTWYKGTPIKQFENGTVYVVEFWATWCKPCKAAMPHLSALARVYKDKVSFLGVDIYENQAYSIKNVQAFVDSMGNRLDYNVAVQDSNFMEEGWIFPSGDPGIPRTFVVNEEGRLAWIGHPKDLGEILPKIVDNSWDIKAALAKRNLDKHLESLNKEAGYHLNMYLGDREKPGDPGKPDWALLVIEDLIFDEPQLKYTPVIAFHTFSSLLKTNLHKAYEYGKIAIVTTTYKEPAYDEILSAIELYSKKLKLPLEIYQLGAEACQLQIDQIPYPEIINMAREFSNMANLYWLAKNKSKAIDSQNKAIESLKTKKDFSVVEMAALEHKLKQYKKI